MNADADTTRATRKSLADLLGDREISDVSAKDWASFNDNVRRIPANHGRSSHDRGKSYADIIRQADREEARRFRRVEAEISKRSLSGDAAEQLRRKAVIARLSPRTLQRHQKYLRAPLDHAVTSGLIPENPFKPYVLGERAIDELRKQRPRHPGNSGIRNCLTCSQRGNGLILTPRSRTRSIGRRL